MSASSSSQTGSLGALVGAACDEEEQDNEPSDWCRSSIITIANAGKWQSAYRYLSQHLSVRPEALDIGLEKPIIWGGDEVHYVNSAGKAGLVQFKKYTIDLLKKHGSVFVLSADKLSCLKQTPGQCIDSIVGSVDGKCKVTMIFKGPLRENLTKFLSGRHNSLSWKPMVVDTPDAADPIDWDAELKADEPASLERLRQDELAMTLAWVQQLVSAKLEADGIAGSHEDVPQAALDKILLEADKLSSRNRLKERRALQHKLLVMKLRGKLPSYSVGSGASAYEFYKEVLSNFASRFALKPPDLAIYSANLYTYLKSQGDLQKLSKKNQSHR